MGTVGQDGGEVLHVVVPEPDEPGAGKAAAVHDGCMIELVADDGVVASDDAGDGGDVGRVAAGEGDGGLSALEARQLRLELPMDGQRAREEPRAMSTGAVVGDGVLRGPIDPRMTVEREI